MGTRGTIGFTAEKTHYLTYNHFDSYPDGLGRDTYNWLVANLVGEGEERQVNNEILHLLAGLEQVSEMDEPTPAQIEKLKARGIQVAERVSTGQDFYAWLRSCQGSLDATLRSGFWMKGGYEFGKDSLFCEWAYVIDVDARCLDTYVGFNHDDVPTEGIWAGIENPKSEELERADGTTYTRENYQPVRRILSTPFTEISSDPADLGAVEGWIQKVERVAEKISA